MTNEEKARKIAKMNMTTDLHKRFDEVAKIMQREVTPHKDWGDIRYGFNRGAELGYKEAIKVAKEWLLNNANNYESAFTGAVFHQQLAEAFETDMNKLWEEMK